MPPVPSPGFIAGPGLAKAEEALAKKKVHGWSRALKLKAFSTGARRVEAALAKFPKPMWRFKPDSRHWCIGEVLWHLADQEANLYLRLRKAVAEPGGMVSDYNQDQWADRTLYFKADFDEACHLLRSFRDANTHLLRRVSGSLWKNKVKHPEFGTISVDYLVGLNIWHIEHHIGQMAKRYREWKERRK